MSKPFNHPATIISKAGIAEMKQRISDKLPFAIRGRDKLSWDTKKEYVPNALQKVVCMWNQPAQGHAELCDKDAVQAYLQCLSYLLLGDNVHAKNALAIIDAWSRTCTEISGDNRVLEASWSTCCFARTMEMLKYTYPGYAASGVEGRYFAWLDKVALPAVNAPINWLCYGDAYSNWHCAKMEALMQVAVLRNDHAGFDAQIAMFKKILPVVIKPKGYANESISRDLMHGCFSVGSLLQVCELAWNAKGVDLYHEQGNLMLKAMEWHAGLIMGEVYPETQGKNINMLKYHPQGAWGVGLSGYGCRGLNAPKTKELLIRNYQADFPWLCWCHTNLTNLRAL